MVRERNRNKVLWDYEGRINFNIFMYVYEFGVLNAFISFFFYMCFYLLGWLLFFLFY